MGICIDKDIRFKAGTCVICGMSCTCLTHNHAESKGHNFANGYDMIRAGKYIFNDKNLDDIYRRGIKK